MNTFKKMKLIRHLVDEFFVLVIDLDRKGTMSAHHFLQKPGNRRSCFVRYLFCFWPLTEIVSTNDVKVAISINLG